LPMLLRSIGYRQEALDALVSRAMVGGSQGVMQVASSSLQNQSARPSHDQDSYHHQQ
ncbi:MAG: PTS fructose transporter subunit IIA, partial [Comamonas sp.]